MSTTALRRTKWRPTPPPPPSPKILHFPRSRRTRRKPTANHQNNPLLLMHQKYLSYKGKLESLFDQENNENPLNSKYSNSKPPALERRERVHEEDFGEHYNGEEDGGFEEEKWRFQAEILRAECNLLRMEREIALKKLEKNRVKMERTLRSAVQTLVSGKKKIFEGKNANAVLEEEIEDLAEKLEELQKSSRVKDYEVRNNCSNFDRKACLLQRRLENLGGLSEESCDKGLQQLAESSLSIDVDKESIVSSRKIENKSNDVDMVREKMEGLSKGLLDRAEEEYSSILSSTANSSVASSASTSKRIECHEMSSLSTRQLYQEPIQNKCSGRCKAIVRKIVEQVRAETEQWSQMQEMLTQVRGEMEELQASRDFWESRAHNSDYEIQSLKNTVEEWKEKALGYENKVNELQHELSLLKEETQKSKSDSNRGQIEELIEVPDLTLMKRPNKEKRGSSRRTRHNYHIIDEKGFKFEKALEELKNIEENKKGRSPDKDTPPLTLGKQLAKEKRMLLLRLKEKRRSSDDRNKKQELSVDGRLQPHLKRSPLRDIGNSSPLARVSSRADFCSHSPESFRARGSFRK